MYRPVMYSKTICTSCIVGYLRGFIRSGGANAVKEPGHFEVPKSSSQVTRMHFFAQKSWQPFLFSVHTITEAKQYVGLGGTRAWARAVDLPAKSFDLARPGVAPPLFILQLMIRDGKEPSLFGFGSVRVLWLLGFGSVRVCKKRVRFCSGSRTTRVRLGFGSRRR